MTCDFSSRQFPLHRREKACRTRLASRLFYAHSDIPQTNFEEFFLSFARPTFCGKEFGATNSLPQFCGMEFCPQDSSKRKNNGKNARKMPSRHFAARNLAQQIRSRRFAGRNFVRKIRPNEKIMARMRARCLPDILRQGIWGSKFVPAVLRQRILREI